MIDITDPTVDPSTLPVEEKIELVRKYPELIDILEGETISGGLYLQGCTSLTHLPENLNLVRCTSLASKHRWNEVRTAIEMSPILVDLFYRRKKMITWARVKTNPFILYPHPMCIVGEDPQEVVETLLQTGSARNWTALLRFDYTEQNTVRLDPGGPTITNGPCYSFLVEGIPFEVTSMDIDVILNRLQAATERIPGYWRSSACFPAFLLLPSTIHNGLVARLEKLNHGRTS